MVAEFTTSKIPRVVYNTFEDFQEDPQRMWDWMYKVSEEVQKNADNSTTNVGDMKFLGADDAPTDWLVTDGSIQQTSSFPALQQFLFPGVVSDTFILPDLQALIVDNTTGTTFSLDTAVKSPFTVVIKT